MLVILEASAAGGLSEVLIVVGIEGVVRVAVAGHGSKALGVGSAEGKGYVLLYFLAKELGLGYCPRGTT